MIEGCCTANGVSEAPILAQSIERNKKLLSELKIAKNQLFEWVNRVGGIPPSDSEPKPKQIPDGLPLLAHLTINNDCLDDEVRDLFVLIERLRQLA